ncbi:MAG: elongation factor G [Planctomycetota bacterium]|nr:MAG: elongation factor G [Planctomycetota bacterium]
MAVYEVGKYRNVVLVGHGGSGKTSLAEAMLHKAGVTNRLGSTADKTSILDVTDEAKEKGGSTDSAVCYLAHKGHHVNIVDTPGTAAFAGPAIGGLIAADTAIVVVSASSGIEVNTRKMFERAKKYGIGLAIVVSKIDAPNVNLEEVLGNLRSVFGNECVPVTLPTGSGKSVIDCLTNESGAADIFDVGEAHTGVLEAIVSVDDAMMEKYLGGEVSKDEALATAPKAVAAQTFIPTFFVNSRAEIGIAELLDAIVGLFPSPLQAKRRVMVDDGHETPVDPTGADFVGQIFKVSSDPKTGIKYLGLRCLSGKLTHDMSIKTVADRKGFRPGQLQRLLGAEHKEVEAGVSGDIVSLAKLDLHVGDVVFTNKGGTIEKPPIPAPMFPLALESKSRGDEDKIAQAIRRYTDEDPCLRLERTQAGEMVLRGLDDTHVRTILNRLKHYFKLEVLTKTPKIPYRETIAGRADNIEYTHKKQTGGAGQYAKIVINVLPAQRGEGYEFVDKIFGGAIDQQFRPSVDKGIRAQMAEGVIAGYPVVDVKVELIDGKTHPVDSKDIAFQIAGRQAFKEGFMKAKPILLEPIVNLEVTVPADKVGDIQGDIASRRGRPVGQDVLPGGLAVIKAQIPLGEVMDYNSRLSSISGGQGSFSIEESHYEPVPGNVQQQVIEQHKKEVEAARE